MSCNHCNVFTDFLSVNTRPANVRKPAADSAGTSLQLNNEHSGVNHSVNMFYAAINGHFQLACKCRQVIVGLHQQRIVECLACS